MTKLNNILTAILIILILAVTSVTVFASSEAIYRSSFWVDQQTNKVDINTYEYENMSCVIVVAHTNAVQASKYGHIAGKDTQSISEGYGSNPAISCVKK